MVGYRLKPKKSMQREFRKVARGRLTDAIDLLDGLEGARPTEIEEAVHSVRKRCKEVRGLARLVRPSLGKEFGRFNQLVRSAAEELSSIRDAHAILATFDDLRLATDHTDDDDLREVRAQQARAAQHATESLQAGDPRIVRAEELLVVARKRVKRWEIDRGFDPMADGLVVTYRRGRRGLRAAEQSTSDHTLHEWRKAVKNLWYQMRLLESASPSVLGPMIESLDGLAESLGDDRDLELLVERLRSDPARFGGESTVERVVDLALLQQQDLRRRAFRLGATLYAEPAKQFVDRIERYWTTTLRAGPELNAGGIAELSGRSGDPANGEEPSTIERERKFLVTSVPDLPASGTEMRQGYLAIDGTVGVRIRQEGERDHTFTVKAGRGAVRTELEWAMEPAQFAAAWAITEERRVHKTRYRVPTGTYIAEVDVFHGELDGLVLAEVEFSSDDELESFEPPAWMGREVTDDVRYTNASLAVSGAPPAS